MNEVNGKTIIGNSDVYLNKNNNFQSESWYIAPAGTLDKETQPDLVSQLGNDLCKKKPQARKALCRLIF